MKDQQNLWAFMYQESDKLLTQTLQHIGLTFISLIIAVLVGLPLGIFIARKKRYSGAVLGIAGVMQTIPSIALLGFMIPLLGIGAKPAIVALFIYALLPIIRNTYTGILGVDAFVTEAATAMGMSKKQILFKVELPLAMPVILAGIRTATVINVGVATLASFIAAGGLGEFIFGGISLNNTNMILAGAIPAALLAIIFDFLLSRLQNIRLKKLKPATATIPVLLLILASLYFIPSAYGSKLLAGFTPEFMGRQDGDLGLKQKYGLKIRTIVISDAVMYKAAFEKELDVISGYSTDGRLKAFGLMVLQDDKGIFPPYYAAPIVRQSSLKKFPDLEKTLDLLAGHINDSIMTELNYRTDYLHQSPERVAKDFLVEQRLFKPSCNGTDGVVRIGSKIFGEQYILAQMYSMLIQGYTNHSVSTKTGLGGTKICFDALTNDQIDLYPEYTGTGLLVLLQPDSKIVDSLTVDKNKTYNFVRTEFVKKYNIAWLKPIGFNNSYALMMRQKQSDQLGVKTISDLKKYLDKK
ncbi:ABC transporter permease/substrate-binding protein [Mucilaginibacter myungsuensis]|uniref:ABC transporter permease/substrate-binding protein n=1 Tax=Mucilaginibacter myungsuensis TaxID=649104 RepID=A0A929KVW1_9SPHI|nr:ABC transporter permease/substrate-binding protein [Mucilaginibacter myungsuensis]MBE9661420.1 ABC transporter permease/substrate-binding protein [Mucilaginibacter myungsuensis]MDN3597563.1 ABC transporter permease/substrate-binding protein [Mucilaginibacter myungsuensis]